MRVHPFPYRTRKLSSLVSKILGWKRPGKIERCQHQRARPIGRAFFGSANKCWGTERAPRFFDHFASHKRVLFKNAEIRARRTRFAARVPRPTRFFSPIPGFAPKSAPIRRKPLCIGTSVPGGALCSRTHHRRISGYIPQKNSILHLPFCPHNRKKIKSEKCN